MQKEHIVQGVRKELKECKKNAECKKCGRRAKSVKKNMECKKCFRSLKRAKRTQCKGCGRSSKSVERTHGARSSERPQTKEHIVQRVREELKECKNNT